METSASGARMKKPASRKTGSKRVLSASRSVHTLWASMSGAGERLSWMIRDSLHTRGPSLAHQHPRRGRDVPDW